MGTLKNCTAVCTRLVRPPEPTSRTLAPGFSLSASSSKAVACMCGAEIVCEWPIGSGISCRVHGLTQSSAVVQSCISNSTVSCTGCQALVHSHTSNICRKAMLDLLVLGPHHVRWLAGVQSAEERRQLRQAQVF